MINRKTSANISITVCSVVGIVLLIFLFFGPKLFAFYMAGYRGFEQGGEALKYLVNVFSYCLYPSLVLAFIILFNLFKLLFNIRREEIFIDSNVFYLRLVSWCCFGVATITLIGGFFYFPIMFVSAATGFIGMLLRVLKNVFQSAVEISRENSLTI